jgi:acyl carrier protein
MNYSTTIKNFIVENFLFGDAGELNEDTNLFDKGIVDSTGVIELVSYLEIYFNIIIEDNELTKDNFSSIGKMAQFLQVKQLSEV